MLFRPGAVSFTFGTWRLEGEACIHGVFMTVLLVAGSYSSPPLSLAGEWLYTIGPVLEDYSPYAVAASWSTEPQIACDDVSKAIYLAVRGRCRRVLPPCLCSRCCSLRCRHMCYVYVVDVAVIHLRTSSLAGLHLTLVWRRMSLVRPVLPLVSVFCARRHGSCVRHWEPTRC